MVLHVRQEIDEWHLVLVRRLPHQLGDQTETVVLYVMQLGQMRDQQLDVVLLAIVGKLLDRRLGRQPGLGLTAVIEAEIVVGPILACGELAQQRIDPPFEEHAGIAIAQEPGRLLAPDRASARRR